MEGFHSLHDCYKEFARNHIVFPTHLQNILMSLGYITEAAFGNFNESEDFEKIESVVRTTFKKLYEKRSPEDRKALFGLFAENIEEFAILPGERALIVAAKEYALLNSQHNSSLLELQMDTPPLGGGTKTKNRRHFSRASLPSSSNDSSSADVLNFDPISSGYVKGKLTESIRRWLKKHEVQMEETYGDHLIDVDEDKLQIYCNACEPRYSVAAYLSNKTVNFGNFSRHVQTKHFKEGFKVRPKKRKKAPVTLVPGDYI